MNASASSPPRSPVLGIGLLVLIGRAGAAVGAYLDWKWWHPMSGIMVTIGAVVL